MSEEVLPAKKPERPRDALGRPLPWGSPSELELEDYDRFPPAENHRLAMEAFDSGRYFPAHEAWEAAWRQLRGTEDEEFFKGLAQLGAGYTHWRRGNPHGARVLLERAIRRLRPYPSPYWGLATRALVELLEQHAERFRAAEERGEREVGLDAPRLPRA